MRAGGTIGLWGRWGERLGHAIRRGACRGMQDQAQRGYREDSKSHHELILAEFRPLRSTSEPSARILKGLPSFCAQLRPNNYAATAPKAQYLANAPSPTVL